MEYLTYYKEEQLYMRTFNNHTYGNFDDVLVKARDVCMGARKKSVGNEEKRW